MKSQLITVLSVVGVVATAGAAMAINSTALGTASNQTIGETTDVLVPVDDGAVRPSRTASPSPTAPLPMEPPTAPASAEPSPPVVVDPVSPEPQATPAPTATAPAPAPTPTRTHDEEDDEGHDDGGVDDD
jgi:hypothetical protein